jgi:tetratricopeptide (TPR) repeat protein/SAM-dependent methyltransferase
LESDPANADAQYYLAVAWCQQGQFDRTIDAAQRALAADPKQARLHNLVGTALSRLGRPADALASFAAAIVCQPDLAEAHGNHADALIQLGRPAEAVASYERAVALRPDSIHDGINLAATLAGLGRYEAALVACDRLLALAPHCTDAHFNRGNVLVKLGRLPEALASFDAALAQEPTHVDAIINCGIVLRDLGRFDDAARAYTQALALEPESTEALFHLGNVLLAQGKSWEAAERLAAALRLRPDHVRALDKLTNILLGQNDTPRALAAVMRSLAYKETAPAKALFVLCIRGSQLLADDSAMHTLVLRALTEPWDRPADVTRAAESIVKLGPTLGSRGVPSSQSVSTSIAPDSRAERLAAIADDPLLQALLETVPVCDVELERFLTEQRSVLLGLALASTTAATDDRMLRAGCGLARQCFINEYVFDVTAAEAERAGALCERLLAAIKDGAAVPALWIAAAAAYAPLHSLPPAAALIARTWPQPVVDLLAQQIAEPGEEQRLRGSIPRLTAIADDVSATVKQQYEENPYPRWIKPAPTRTVTSLDDYFASLFGVRAAAGPRQEDTIHILIAGCGTGQALIETARQFKGARVLGIDLSSASLCYALRQVRALGLDNIELAEADILELPSVGRTFDVVDASGVLHHLANPWDGWRALLSMLRPGGFMHVCLYSALARRDITAARAFIAERGYRPTATDIRRCRQEILALGDDAAIKNVARWRDFFTLSECRDMLFHVQEHQLTLPAIAAFLAENRAEFLGFAVDANTQQRFKARFPAGSAKDLALWDVFERENPAAFVEMYQFWIRKPV